MAQASVTSVAMASIDERVSLFGKRRFMDSTFSEHGLLRLSLNLARENAFLREATLAVRQELRVQESVRGLREGLFSAETPDDLIEKLYGGIQQFLRPAVFGCFFSQPIRAAKIFLPRGLSSPQRLVDEMVAQMAAFYGDTTLPDLLPKIVFTDYNDLAAVESVQFPLVSCRLIENQVDYGLFAISKEIERESGYQLLLNSYGQEAIQAARSQHKLEIARASALTDGLTGLYNYRGFRQFIEKEFDQSRRYTRPLSLILLDIDHFKTINDTFGHPVGDTVLEEVAGLLQANARTSDYVTRYGGEEFALILPETDEIQSVRFAERLRRAIATHPFADPIGDRRVRASFGIASIPRDDVYSLEQLISEADHRLYHAKHIGRDCVVSRIHQ